MRGPGRTTAAVAVTALVAGLLTGALAGAPPAAAETVAKTARLTDRVDGMPTTDVASRRIASATVRQDLTRGEVRGTVVLRGRPGAGSVLHLAFGRWSGDTCQASVELSTPTTGPLAEGFRRSGATITLAPSSSSGSWSPDLDCAFAVLVPEAGGTPYDALVGGLREVAGKPRFTVGRAELLGKKQRPVGLVPRVWTRLDVPVSNRGTLDASAVRITGKGRGIDVRAVRLGELETGDTTEAEVWVRLARPLARTTAVLTVRGGGASTQHRIAVKRVRPPARPAAGRYQARIGTNQWIRFRVQRGRIIDFTARLQATCGSGPGVPTHPYLDLDFATVKVPASGIVQARDRRRPQEYGAGLDGRLVGPRLSQGHFWFAANGCRVIQSFTARRTGR